MIDDGLTDKTAVLNALKFAAACCVTVYMKYRCPSRSCITPYALLSARRKNIRQTSTNLFVCITRHHTWYIQSCSAIYSFAGTFTDDGHSIECITHDGHSIAFIMFLYFVTL